jgi:hypothetical protein
VKDALLDTLRILGPPPPAASTALGGHAEPISLALEKCAQARNAVLV